MTETTPPPPLADDPQWYKDAVIYQLHVKAFFDSNGDGIGDFPGLTAKLDYIQDLGVNTLWLLPFYPSPMRDDGYDIADYRNINPDYGTLKDFRTFMREAHRRGLRVITELVINHTSDQHPWFQEARRAPPDSAKRNFYVWSDSDKKFPETRIIFTDTETSNWAWDPVAQQYYWHRFFSHQPDLNHNNPNVVRAVIGLLRFWLDAGVDGLRLDAIPYLCVREGTTNENLPETHDVLKKMRAVVDQHYRGRMFLAEANQWPEDVRDYFGNGDECHMAYHFPLMPRIYMAVAQEDRHPITEIMGQTPDIPDTCQWAIFLRNHDELTLEMVTDKERDYMYQVYANDKRMRLNVGIRRRLAPLMDNDLDKIKLMNSLLMSMPGSPIIYYGDEIGMGDNIFLGDRNGVRTPMQWNIDRNAGFSQADPQRLYLPTIMDPIYGYQAVNVEAQTRDRTSLLNWMKRTLAVRKSTQAFGRGRLEFLRPGNRKILAYVREHGQDRVLCVANLSRSAQPVELDLARFKGCAPIEMMGQTPFPPIGDLPYLLTLPGYGVYWFRLTQEGQIPHWHEERLTAYELPVLVVPDGWRSFFPERADPTRAAAARELHIRFERDLLPAFLRTQRWFDAKDQHIERVEIYVQKEWAESTHEWLLAWIKIHIPHKRPQVYSLPLALMWGEDEDRNRALATSTLARVRQRARVGILCDAASTAPFCSALVRAMGEQREMPFGEGKLRFSSTALYRDLAEGAPAELSLRRPASESSNSVAILGERFFLKSYRRLRNGLNPELEVGRFLTEQVSFPHIIPVAGALEYLGNDGTIVTLALLQRYVENQGDAWTHALNYARLHMEHARLTATQPDGNAVEAAQSAEIVLFRALGQRTGELHRALATNTGNTAFDPEPVTAKDLHGWVERVEKDLHDTIAMLSEHRHGNPAVGTDVDRLLQHKDALRERIKAVAQCDIDAIKARFHGDLHLGQCLIVHNDVVIIDFEGEPGRPFPERRIKHSPLRDVSGMLRSFGYAARTALNQLAAERATEIESLELAAQTWTTRAGDTFYSAYREAVGDCRVLPRDASHARALIELFVIEKALYEIRYELQNRPSWLNVPLRDLIELARSLK